MISIRDITVSYGDTAVLKNLSLDLEEGKVHGIVGLNGSGKTTLLNVLYGLKKAQTGDILWNGMPLSKGKAAFVEVEDYFYPGITGREYLELFENAGFRLSLWENLLQLPLDRLIDTYSTGMKRKLSILAALKRNKELQILDEPFNGLDIESCEILRMILLKLKEAGKTVLLTSHILDVLPGISDYIHHLSGGIVKKTYPVTEFDAMKTEIRSDIGSRTSGLIDAAFA